MSLGLTDLVLAASVSQSDTILHPHRQGMRILLALSVSSSTFGTVSLLNFSHFSGYILPLICISLMTSDVEHLVIFLLAVL